MSFYVGDAKLGTKVHIYWSSNDNVGASIDRSTNGEIRVYKNSSGVELTGSAITDTEAFDGLTGVHLVVIDTANNSEQAGFFAAGNEYAVVLVGAVIDGQAVNAVIGTFSIENRTAADLDIPDCAEPPTAGEIAVEVWNQKQTIVVSSFAGEAEGQLSEQVSNGLSSFGAAKQSDVDSGHSTLESLLNAIKNKTDELAFTDKKVHALIFGGGNSGLSQKTGVGTGGINIAGGSS